MWTKFYHPTTLDWTIVDILQNTYPLLYDQPFAPVLTALKYKACALCAWWGKIEVNSSHLAPQGNFCPQYPCLTFNMTYNILTYLPILIYLEGTSSTYLDDIFDRELWFALLLVEEIDLSSGSNFFSDFLIFLQYFAIQLFSWIFSWIFLNFFETSFYLWYNSLLPGKYWPKAKKIVEMRAK